MTRINILDDSTINKIAAGEVIERPSSIIKEVVENSLDAGAKTITIQIENAGKDMIKVIDNGSGIDADDINKAFLRHATSKIRRAEDLSNLHSLGFRGEALASIAAVSKVDMTTKTKDALMGTRLLINGGKIESKSPVGANTGTQLIVKDLFYNVPARRKFLKSNHAEIINITDLINKLAIGNPGVSIKYINNGKTIFETIGDSNLYNTIRMIYGKDTSDNLIKIDYQSAYYKIDGYIANNNVYRSNRNNQLIFINGRYVKSPNIMDAINSAYKDIIPINKYPVYFINLQIDPAKIDVNIHPSKLEVKFDNEGPILEDLGDYIRGSLLKNSLVGRYRSKDLAKKSYESNDTFRTFDSFTYTKNEQKTNSDLVRENGKSAFEAEENIVLETSHNHKDFDYPKHDIEKASSSSDKTLYKPDHFTSLSEIRSLENRDILGQDDKYTLGQHDLTADKVNIRGRLDSINKATGTSADQDHQLSFVEEDTSVRHEFDGLNYIGIVFNTYILFSKSDQLYMMDQHAAHERIMFEKVKANYYNDVDKDSQLMLLPDIITLSNKEMGIFRDNKDLFNKAGFTVDEFGDNTVKLTGVPEFCLDFDTRSLFLDTLDEMDTVARTAKQELEYKFLATVACKAAVKAHMALSKEEVDSLFEQLYKLPNPFSCPHGRPTVIKMTKTDIEKKFSRIQ